MDISQNEIKLISKRANPKEVVRLLETLAKTSDFVDAFNSKTGQELLLDATTKMASILEKIINEEETPQEKAEFRAYRSIVSRWVGIINNHKENDRKLKGEKHGN